MKPGVVITKLVPACTMPARASQIANPVNTAGLNRGLLFISASRLHAVASNLAEVSAIYRQVFTYLRNQKRFGSSYKQTVTRGKGLHHEKKDTSKRTMPSGRLPLDHWFDGNGAFIPGAHRGPKPTATSHGDGFQPGRKDRRQRTQ